MFVRPAPGLKIRDPLSRVHIPESGIEVSDTDPFWARRLLAGDIVISNQAVRDLRVRAFESEEVPSSISEGVER